MNNKERYEYYKSIGRCIRCGKVNKTKHVLCDTCNEKEKERKKKNASKISAMKAERIRNGICPYCGKRPLILNLHVCETCRIKRNISHKKRRMKIE